MKLTLSVKDVAKASATAIIPNPLRDHQQSPPRATGTRAPLAKPPTHLVKSMILLKLIDFLPFRMMRRLKRARQAYVPRRIASYLMRLPTQEIKVL
jgi:hypothetical protein